MSGLLRRLPRKIAVAGLAGAGLVAATMASPPVGWLASGGPSPTSWLGATQPAFAADSAAGAAATGAAGTGVAALSAVPAGWLELPDRRDECSKRYATEDGQMVARIWAGPVHYRDAAWRWQDISNRLVPDGAGTGFVNEANSFKVWLARRVGGAGAGSAATGDMAAPAARFSYGSASFALAPEGAADASAVVAGSSVTYPNVYPGVDFRYEAGNTELKELVVLRRLPSKAVWRFRLAVDGLRLQEDAGESIDGSPGVSSGATPAAVSGSSGGRLGLYSALTGRRLARFGNLIMHDSATNRGGEPVQSSKVGFRVELVDGRPVGVLSADAAWLADPKRVYPVYIDPTITKDAIGDTYISSAYPSNNYDRDCADGYYQLKCGYYSSATGTNHSLVKFSIASLYGVRVTSATLKMYCEHSYYATTDTPVWCNRATEYWSETGSNWSGRPSSSGLTSDSVRRGNWASFGVTGCVQNWTDKIWDNYGFVVHEGSYGAGYWKKFRARENSSGAPYLQVSYAPGVKVTGPNAGFSGEWLTDPQPTFSWQYSSPEPQQKYRVQVGTSSTTWDASTVLADSGEMSSRDETWAPSAPLPDGKLYWRVRGYDGAVWSWWDTGSFRLDANGPTAGIISPAADNTVSGTVTVTAFADDTAAANAGNGSTRAGAISGTAKVVLLSNGREIAEDTSAPYAFNWGTEEELNGHSTLALVSFDVAGNQVQGEERVLHVENALPPATEASYMREWFVLGPFDGRAYSESEGARLAQDYLAEVGGETNVLPYGGLVVSGSGPAAGRTWATMSVDTSYVALGTAFAAGGLPPEKSVAYAAKWVRCDNPEGAHLKVGSDSGVRIWLNGSLVHRFDATRAYVADEDDTEVLLQEGWNLVLVKLSNLSGTRGFSAKLCDDEDGRIPGLYYRFSRPEPSLMRDNFNAADGAPRSSDWRLGGTTGTSGPGNAPAVAVEDCRLSVESAPGSGCFLLSEATVNDTDYAFSIDVAYESKPAAGWQARPIFRARDTRNYYGLKLGSTDVSGSEISLVKCVDGTETVLGVGAPFTPRVKPTTTAASNGTPWGPHHVRVELRGNNIRVFVDGVSYLSRTDSAANPPVGTRVGAMVSGGNHVHFDNVVVEPLAGRLPDASVAGTVRSPSKLLSGATVLAVSVPQSGEDPEERSAVTDSNGAYCLMAPPGTYTQYVKVTGLAQKSRSITLVTQGLTPTASSFILDKAAAVAGTVTDVSGRRIAGVQVVASGFDESVGLQCVGEATTDARGNYVIEDLDAPGEYELSIDADGYSSVSKCAIHVETGVVTAVHDADFGPSYGLSSTGTTLASRFGAVLNSYAVAETLTSENSMTTDATLAPAATLTGTVVDVQGNPLAGVGVIATPASCEEAARQGATDANGRFHLADLDSPANYTVDVVGEEDVLTSASVDVGAGAQASAGTIVASSSPAFATASWQQARQHRFKTHERMVMFSLIRLWKAKGNTWLYRFLKGRDPYTPAYCRWETIARGIIKADNGGYPFGDHAMTPWRSPWPKAHSSWGKTSSGAWANHYLRQAHSEWDVTKVTTSQETFNECAHNALFSLGIALHAVQDNREPHHAALKVCVPHASPHAWYEDWVRDYRSVEIGDIDRPPIYNFKSLKDHYNDRSAWGWVDRSGHTAYYGKNAGQTYYQWVDKASLDFGYSPTLHRIVPIHEARTIPLLKSGTRATGGFIYGFFSEYIKGGAYLD